MIKIKYIDIIKQYATSTKIKPMNELKFKNHIIKAIKREEIKIKEIEDDREFQNLMEESEDYLGYNKDVCALIIEEKYSYIKQKDYITKLYRVLTSIFLNHYKIKDNYVIDNQNIGELRNMSIYWGFVDKEYLESDFDFLERK